jgi:hypothetical protein
VIIIEDVTTEVLLSRDDADTECTAKVEVLVSCSTVDRMEPGGNEECSFRD